MRGRQNKKHQGGSKPKHNLNKQFSQHPFQIPNPNFSSFADPSFSYKMNPTEPSSTTTQSLATSNSKVVGAFITYSSSRKYIEQDPFGDFINLCHLPSGSTIYTNK
jgi:hypothetical protein